MDPTTQCILIIEDDELLLDLLQEVLSDEGYRVMVCATIEVAQQSVQVALPDLIILDLHLAGGQLGLELLAWLRRRQATLATPVIICSGDVLLLRAQAQALDRHHCFAVIEKPLDIDDLLVTVSVAIGPAQIWYRVSAA